MLLKNVQYVGTIDLFIPYLLGVDMHVTYVHVCAYMCVHTYIIICPYPSYLGYFIFNTLISLINASPNHSDCPSCTRYNVYANNTTDPTQISTDFQENNQILPTICFLNSPTGFPQSPVRPVQFWASIIFFFFFFFQ